MFAGSGVVCVEELTSHSAQAARPIAVENPSQCATVKAADPGQLERLSDLMNLSTLKISETEQGNSCASSKTYLPSMNRSWGERT